MRIKLIWGIITLISTVMFSSALFADNPTTTQRLNWNAQEMNTSISGTPSNLKFFKYYDVMPDDITLPIYQNMDLSTINGKKLFVGYGTVDPGGNTCRFFPDLNRTECLPWWRIEREYSIPQTNSTPATDFLKNLTMLYPPKNIQYCKDWQTMEQVSGGQVTCVSYYDKRISLDCLANPKQDACKVDLCSAGIKQSCTLAGTQTGDVSTLNAPIVGNDGTIVAADMITGLQTYQYNCPAGYLPGKVCKDWIYAVTYPYECKPPTSVQANDGEYVYCDTNPAPYYDNTGNVIGFTSQDACSNREAMDGQMGSNGKQRLCPVNSYSQTQKVCKSPITQVNSSVANQTVTQKRVSHDYETSVLFGDEAGDIYSNDTSCLRLNTVEGARTQNLTTHIIGSGNLDDDIYVFAHKSNGSYNKIYCNMQHNANSLGNTYKWVATHNTSHRMSTGTMNITATLTMDTGETSTVSKAIQIVSSGGLNNTGVDLNSPGSASVDASTSFVTSVYSGPTIVSVSISYSDGLNLNATLDSQSTSFVNKAFDGDTLQCIQNGGNYHFDQNVSIQSSDIVSIQQASEMELVTQTPMYDRHHYGSSAVTIDGVLSAPITTGYQFPNYPHPFFGHGMSLLQTWDNALSTLSLMFPYAGAYQIFVYGGSTPQENKLLGQATLTIDDFKNIPAKQNIQLKMGQVMSLAPGISDGNTSGACRNDDFVDWGGGVWNSPIGSKGDMSGCIMPNDTYAKANSAYNIVIKDLLTGTVTPVPLVYPLPYPNRIFISRLNVVENRKYRCYDPFPDVGLSSGCTIGAQNESSPASDYRGDSVNLVRNTTIYCDVTSEQIIGCKDQSTIENQGGVSYPNADQYDTLDNSGMYLGALAGAQLSEQMMHIWSGWPGMCEHGVFTDFSWMSDPMTLASLAMSAYGSLSSGAQAATDANTAASTAAQGVGEGVDKAETASQFATRLQGLQSAAYDASHTISNTLYQALQNGLGSTTTYFTGLASSAESGVSNLVSGATTTAQTTAIGQQVNNGLSDLKDVYNSAVTTATKIYDNTFNVQGALSNLADQITAEATTLGTLDQSSEAYAALAQQIASDSAQYAQLDASFANAVYHTVDTVKTTFSSLFTNPDTAASAQSAAANGVVDAGTNTVVMSPEGFIAKFDAINTIKVAGFGTIKWTEIASAGETMYSNIAAKREDMIAAFKAQQAYVMSGQGTSNDIAANAYASCMASVGAGFVNTISYTAGAADENTTSAQLLDPTTHPMRISFESLQGLRSLVGDSFFQMSYMIKDLDYNMQMCTLVALNAQAYTQLTQMVCGGYEVSALTNALNLGSNAKPSMMDALMHMSPMQAATMAASMACNLAGPYAFACQLCLKLLTSFSSGNACTDEKIAQSQKPIQLKTNKFSKFGQCHHVRSTCSAKTLLGCTRTAEHYCCYDQIMTRIFAEGVKEERGTDWSSCNDITINDLQYITFTPCQPGQDPHLNRCFPVDKYNELTDVMKTQIKKGIAGDTGTFVQQVQNAMDTVQ